MSSERVTVPMRDLACAGCVSHVEQVMRDQDGVIWATINFAAQEVLIIYDPLTFDPGKLVDAVRDLGYDLRLEAGQMKPLKSRLPIRNFLNIPGKGDLAGGA